MSIAVINSMKNCEQGQQAVYDKSHYPSTLRQCKFYYRVIQSCERDCCFPFYSIYLSNYFPKKFIYVFFTPATKFARVIILFFPKILFDKPVSRRI